MSEAKIKEFRNALKEIDDRLVRIWAFEKIPPEDSKTWNRFRECLGDAIDALEEAASKIEHVNKNRTEEKIQY